MLEAGTNELRNAFFGHLRVAADGTESSHYLLLFYAAECGLKFLWLRRGRLRSTRQIQDEELRQSHDLLRWVKELRVPASVSAPLQNVRLQRGGSADVRRLHEAWRYGIRIFGKDEGHIVDWLRRVCGWVAEEVRQ